MLVEIGLCWFVSNGLLYISCSPVFFFFFGNTGLTMEACWFSLLRSLVEEISTPASKTQHIFVFSAGFNYIISTAGLHLKFLARYFRYTPKTPTCRITTHYLLSVAHQESGSGLCPHQMQCFQSLFGSHPNVCQNQHCHPYGSG